MIEYCRQGGVVEACPATQEITNLTVDFEIEPNGNVKMLTCGDQVHSGPFYCWGWSTPQASVEPEVLEKIILRIANAAKVTKQYDYITIKKEINRTEKFLVLERYHCSRFWTIRISSMSGQLE